MVVRATDQHLTDTLLTFERAMFEAFNLSMATYYYLITTNITSQWIKHYHIMLMNTSKAYVLHSLSYTTSSPKQLEYECS